MNKISSSNTSYTSWQRIISAVVIFFFTAQISMPALAGVADFLESAQIEAEINANYAFKRDNSEDFQFTSAEFLDDSVHRGDANIESLFERFKQSHKQSLGQPQMIPIMVGNITVIIPHYPLAKRIGTNFVQSRYVRSQVYAVLGRTLIDTQVYGGERNQIAKLYDNAYNYALVSDKQFGEPLGLAAEQITIDMIWPEVRYINGENVLVPILYLKPETIASQKVTGDVHEFGGSNVVLNDLVIDNTAIKFRRNAFLRVAEDLINNRGDLIAENNLKIVAGGSLQNISGIIQSDGDLVIGAHSVENRTIVHRYDLGNIQNERFGEIAKITSTGDVILKTSGDIIVQGAEVSAGQNIVFKADGSIYIGSQKISNFGQGNIGGINFQRSTISYLASMLSATEAIVLAAQGQIAIDASKIVSDQGQIELLAGLGITIEDELNVRQSHQKGRFGRRKTETSIYQTVAIRSLLDAGKGVRLHTEFGDITLKATEIRSTEGTQIKATNGAVNLLMTTEADHYSYSSIKKGLFTISTKNRGHNFETGVNNTIIGGLAVEALKGVRVEYESNPNLSLDEQIQELSKFDGMEWMADIRQTVPDVDWQAVDLAYEEWSESNTSLNAAALALITIIVAVCTAGAGAAMIGAAGGTATSTSTLGLMMNAGFTAMVNTATIATANATVNGGKFEEILKAGFESVHEKEGLKSIATSVVTAGALAKVDSLFFDASKNGVTPDITTTETVIRNGIVENISPLSFTGQAVQAVTHAVMEAGVSVVIEGGSFDDFQDQFAASLTGSAISLLGKEMAQSIAEADMDTALSYAFSAGAGCITGTLSAATGTSVEDDRSQACATGAGGAVVGRYIGEAYSAERQNKLEEKQRIFLEKNGISGTSDLALLTSQEYGKYLSELPRFSLREINKLQQQGVDIARLSAALAAFVAGADVQLANEMAQTSANFTALHNFRQTLSAVNALQNYMQLEELVGFAEALQKSGSDKEKVLALIRGLAENPQFKFLQSMPADEALWQIYKLLDTAGPSYSWEFTSIFNDALGVLREAGFLDVGTDSVDDIVYSLVNTKGDQRQGILDSILADQEIYQELVEKYGEDFTNRSGDPSITLGVEPWIIHVLSVHAGLSPSDPSLLWQYYLESADALITDPVKRALADQAMGNIFGMGQWGVNSIEGSIGFVGGGTALGLDAIEFITYLATDNPKFSEGAIRFYSKASEISQVIKAVADDPLIVTEQYKVLVAEIDQLKSEGRYAEAGKRESELAIELMSVIFGVSSVTAGSAYGLKKLYDKRKNGDGLDDPNSAANKLRISFGRKLVSNIENEALIIIMGNTTSALRKKAAVSGAGVPELDITSKLYTNISVNKVKKFDGVTIVADDSSLFRITNVDEYIDGIRRRYRDAPDSATLNVSTENLIRDYIGEPGSKVFSTDHGLPGLHAEVRAANDVYNQLGSRVNSLQDRIQVATYKVAENTGQGGAFKACNNCGGILPTLIFEILTGR